MNEMKKEVERLQEEITALRAAKDEAERAKNEYMQNVAHQLAAPINAIKMNIEALGNPQITVTRKQVMLRSIYAQGTILAHLIKNFTLMSHLEEEHTLDSFREKPEDVDLYLLYVNLSNDFQPIGKQKNQSIYVIEQEFNRLRRPKIRVIKNLFSQVIYNLLENATKYADEDSKITIGVRAEDKWISTTINNTGVPISDNDAVHIFERGFRGDSARKYHPAGTGFGLYIAQRIMEIHGGKIILERDNRKTTFVIRCPKHVST